MPPRHSPMDLPDGHSLLCGTIHRLTLRDRERLEERLDIAEGDIHTVLAERMHVALRERTHLGLADVLCPEVGIVENRTPGRA